MRLGWIWTALIVIIIAAGSYALYIYLKPDPLPNQVLYGNGHVEGTEIHVPAEISGKVTQSHTEEGKKAEAGQLIYELDSTALALRQDRARAQIRSLELDGQRARREQEIWQHHLENAKRDLERFRDLRAKGTIPEQRLDQAENVYAEARGRVAALKAEIGAIEGKIAAARRELDLVDNQLQKARISAPVAGTVLTKAVEAGEFVQPGQTVAVLVDLTRIELKVFLPLTQIGKIKIGDPARVRVDAFPDRYFQGRVTNIDQQAQFTPRDIHMPEERVRMVFGATLALDNPDGLLKPGMPADAWILWQTGSDWPARLFIPQ